MDLFKINSSSKKFLPEFKTDSAQSSTESKELVFNFTPPDVIKAGYEVETTTGNSSTSSTQDIDEELKPLINKRDAQKKVVNSKQSELENIINDGVVEVKQAKEEMDTACDDYHNAVEENIFLNEELKAKIEENGIYISETQKCIKAFEIDIELTKTEIAENDAQLKANNSSINSIKSSIQGLEGQLASADDESKKSIRHNIHSLREKLGIKEAEKVNLETLKENYANKKQALEDNKTKAEEKLKLYKQKEAELAAEAGKLTPDLKEKYNLYKMKEDIYNNLLSNQELLKDNLKKQLEKERALLAQCEQNIVNKENEIRERKIQEQAKKDAKVAQSAWSSGSSGDSSSLAASQSAASNATVEELQQNVDTAKQELSAKENELYSIYNGTDAKVKELKDNRDKKFDDFCKALTDAGQSKVALEIKNAKANVDNLEISLHAKEREIAQFEADMGASVNTSTQLTMKISGLEESKMQLEGTDKTKLNDTQKSELETKITNLNTELSNLKAQKEQLDSSINDANRLEELKQQRDKIKQDYDKANADLETLMDRAISNNPSISNLSGLKSSYVEAKNSYTSEIDNRASSISGEITTLREKVKNLSNTFYTAEKNNTVKYNGSKIVIKAHENYSAISDKVAQYGSNAKFIEKLHPVMQEKVMQLADYAKSKGINFKLISGMRTLEAQQYLKKTKGKWAASPGKSFHEFGVAIDINRHAMTAAQLNDLGSYAQSIGLDWGRHTCKEDWHFDMRSLVQRDFG